uniref:DNA mismatch repair proteins mutS family domain-containing protein n=1 Tax=viral metagenome TaxID=1070528 RepID=A0A6C0FA37_9ZZZZ|tara:strand:- start:4428 stop:6125 length:1698 start_codon:yes stop_codon:yes gene_type:complete
MKLNFKYPIEYLQNKYELNETVKNDLELLNTHDEKNKPIYEHLLQPHTNVGKESLGKFSNYYTTNVDYLKETQKINVQMDKINIDNSLIDKTYNNWNNIKNDEEFIDKYQYIGWDRFKWLNYSQIFLHILTIYNLASPIFNLFSPLLLFIMPYIILRGLKMKITWATYKKILYMQLQNHAIGQLFTSFHKVKLNQKAYILFCAGMYVFNLYQNILSCRRFYKNAFFISENIDTLRQYLKYTIQKMKTYEKIIDNKKTYNKFKSDLVKNREELENFVVKINNIPKKSLNVKNIMQLGSIMKYFYAIYDDFDLENILNYSFGFNGYMDNMKGLSKNLSEKKINLAKFKEKKSVLKFKNIYHPSIKNPIKNDINFKKNKIITGPNAAGKTTILKATILNTIFCQQFGLGYFDSATISPFNYIQCYINIPDTSGRDSLFQAEARRCKEILDIIQKNPHSRHFCVFDELYSGTNPYEAISSAASYLKYITKKDNVRFMLTTHFIRLCDIFKDDKKIENFSMKTDIINDTPKYHYKIQEGISKIKGGITVLKEIKYPKEILTNAKNILEKL